MKRCKHIEADGFHHCSSYAFNLEKDDIEQGDLCDVHYWQAQAQKAVEAERQAFIEKIQAEIDHAAINDTRLAPSFGKREGALAVRIGALEAALDAIRART